MSADFDAIRIRSDRVVAAAKRLAVACIIAGFTLGFFAGVLAASW